jgi:hypothetical protein
MQYLSVSLGTISASNFFLILSSSSKICTGSTLLSLVEQEEVAIAAVARQKTRSKGNLNLFIS